MQNIREVLRVQHAHARHANGNVRGRRYVPTLAMLRHGGSQQFARRSARVQAKW
jgi:hypothetical protein